MADLLRGRYEVLDIVGRGGQGDVASAWDHQLGRPVALKIRPLWTGEDRDALLAEARVLLDMRPHASLPVVREDFFDGDRYVLVMDWIEGIDLSKILAAQGDPGLPVSVALDYLAQIAAALDHLHAHAPAIVHGDVKPANAILTTGGRVVLVDFGLATTGRRLSPLLGSSGYVAPEVLANNPPTPAADVYGLAATACSLLTGGPPADGEAHLDGFTAAARGPIERALRRGLSINAAERPRSAGELVTRMGEYVGADLPTGVVTFCLTDIEGSTGLWEEHPEAMALALTRHEHLVAQAIEDNGGRIFKARGEGDSTLSAFQRASDAVRASIVMQRLLAHETWPGGIELSVRVALHTGEAQLRDGDYFGPTLNRAARVRALAAGGQVLLSRATADLVADTLPTGAALIELGAHELRGMSRAEVVYAVDHPDLVTPRALAAVAKQSAVPTAAAEPAPLAGAALPTNERTSFVGRVAELAQLRRQWTEAKQGNRQIAFIAGEPGIGKTRLATEMAREAQAEGAGVVVGRCDQHSSLPYQPFVEALRGFIGAVPDDTLELALGEHANELQRILPELAKRMPGLQPPPPAEPEAERYRLFEAVGSVLDRAVINSPGMLLLDDLHWADNSSLLLLRHLLRRPGRRAAMIIATYRDYEVGREHPLTAVLAELNRDAGFGRVMLSGLGEADVESLIASVSGAQPAARTKRFARLLRSRTDGNPLFVYEMVRSLVDRSGDAGEPTLASVDADELEIPTGVREVIEQRLLRLSDDVNTALGIAAAVGADFALDVVDRVAGLEGDAILDAIDNAVDAGLIVAAPGPVERYRFSHAMVRETLYTATLQARRRRLHLRIGEAIEQVYAGRLDDHLSELAYHFKLAAPGGGERALEYSIAAGQAAGRQLAHAEAAAHFTDALELLADREPERRTALLLELGQARWSAGHYAAARDAFQTAAALAQAAGDGESLGQAALGFGGKTGFVAGRVDLVLIELLQRALAHHASDDTPLRALLLGRLAEALTFTADVTRRKNTAAEAVAVARRLDDPTVLAQVLSNWHWAMWSPDTLEDRIAAASEIIAIATNLDDATLEIQGRIWRLADFAEAGRIDAATAEIDMCGRLLERMREPFFEWLYAVVRVMRLLLRGDLDDADALSWEAFHVGAAMENPSAAQLFGVHSFVLAELRGRLPSLRASTKAMADHFPEVPGFRAALMSLYCQTGQKDLAREELAIIAGKGFDSLPRDIFWLSCMEYFADASVALDEPGYAKELYELLLPFADRIVILGAGSACSGSAERALGALASLLNRWDDAERHFDAAIAANERIGAPNAILLTKLSRAQMLLARGADGDVRRARELAADVEEGAEAIGAHGLRLRAQALLRGDVPIDSDARRAPRGLRERASDAKAAISVRGRSALARSVRTASDDDLERRYGSSVAQRAAFSAVTRAFQPRLAYGFSGDIVIELLHPEDGSGSRRTDWWTVTIGEGRASARRGSVDDPAVTIHVTVANFIRLLAGELNPVGAYIEGTVRAEGDVLLAPRMSEMFGGVIPSDVVGGEGVDSCESD